MTKNERKIENLKFLRESYNKKDMIDDEKLCEWYFHTEEKSIKICAHRAYEDFCRLLSGISQSEGRDKWREEEEKVIESDIKRILEKSPTELKQKENILGKERYKNWGDEITAFDKWHDKLCEKIIMIFNKHKESLSVEFDFKYGLAQKWLNMTFKNMIVMEIDENISNKMDKLKDVMHVPIDSYIMEAASIDKIPILRKDSNDKNTKYNEEKSKRWSTWDYPEYFKFQKDIREMCKGKQPPNFPIEWEGPKWREISKNKKINEINNALERLNNLANGELLDDEVVKKTVKDAKKMLEDIEKRYRSKNN